MADLIEALHNLARERARGGPSPLVALRRFPARPGARISHLGISQRLAQAWDVPLQRRAMQLSVGQRQKLSILAALGHEPELLILDEPVASLDPLARRQFLQELIDMVSDGSRTILFSTHIVSDLERIASRVWILKDGRLVVDEPLDALKERAERLELAATGSGFSGLPATAGKTLEEIFLELHR